MEVHFAQTAAELLEHCQGTLLRHEAEHNLLLGSLCELRAAALDGPSPELPAEAVAAWVCVASLSHRMLDSGLTHCFLFTDLANPTSNRIYQAIGYRAVADVAQVRFEPPVSPAAHRGNGTRRPK